MNRDFCLRDLNAGPLEDHRKRRWTAIIILLFDEWNTHYDRAGWCIAALSDAAVGGLRAPDKKPRNDGNKNSVKKYAREVS